MVLKTPFSSLLYLCCITLHNVDIVDMGPVLQAIPRHIGAKLPGQVGLNMPSSMAGEPPVHLSK